MASLPAPFIHLPRIPKTQLKAIREARKKLIACLSESCALQRISLATFEYSVHAGPSSASNRQVADLFDLFRRQKKPLLPSSCRIERKPNDLANSPQKFTLLS
ncbi:MAG: hypothetical protein MHPSP_004217, partial [Paramarteilia canceri]